MCSRGLGCFPNKRFVLHMPCLRVSSFLAICAEISTLREKKADREAQEKYNAYLFGRRQNTYKAEFEVG